MSTVDPAKLTPMMQRYLEVKAAILAQRHYFQLRFGWDISAVILEISALCPKELAAGSVGWLRGFKSLISSGY